MTGLWTLRMRIQSSRYLSIPCVGPASTSFDPNLEVRLALIFLMLGSLSFFYSIAEDCYSIIRHSQFPGLLSKCFVYRFKEAGCAKLAHNDTCLRLMPRNSGILNLRVETILSTFMIPNYEFYG